MSLLKRFEFSPLASTKAAHSNFLGMCRFSFPCNPTMIIDPREAIAKLPLYLTQKYGVRFIWSAGVTTVSHPSVGVGQKSMKPMQFMFVTGLILKLYFQNNLHPCLSPNASCK